MSGQVAYLLDWRVAGTHSLQLWPGFGAVRNRGTDGLGQG